MSILNADIDVELSGEDLLETLGFEYIPTHGYMYPSQNGWRILVSYRRVNGKDRFKGITYRYEHGVIHRRHNTDFKNSLVDVLKELAGGRFSLACFNL